MDYKFKVLNIISPSIGKTGKRINNDVMELTDDEEDGSLTSKMVKNKILCTPSDEITSDKKKTTKGKLSTSFSQSLYISDSDETNCSNFEINKQRKTDSKLPAFSQDLFSSDSNAKKMKKDSVKKADQSSSCSVISISDSEEDEEDNRNDHFYNDDQISNLQENRSLNSTELSKLNNFFDNVPSLRSPRLSCLQARQKQQEAEMEHVYISETESEKTNNDKENEVINQKVIVPSLKDPSRNIASQTTISNTIIEKSDSGNEKAKKKCTPTKNRQAKIISSKEAKIDNDNTLNQSKNMRKNDNSYVEKVNISAKIKINVQISTFDDDSSESCASSPKDNKNNDRSSVQRKQKVNVRNRVKINTKNPNDEKCSEKNGNKTLKNNCNILRKTKQPSDAQQNSDDTINEDMEKILNEVYGQSWKTPAMLKKCASRIKEQPADNDSHDFSLFHRELPNGLESTRIGSPVITKENTFTGIRSQKTQETDSSSDEEANKSSESRSSLESEASSDWKCEEDESSDSSTDKFLIKRKNIQRKAKHKKDPPSVCDDEKKITDELPAMKLKSILDTCEFKKKIGIPATPATEKRDDALVKRKLFTPKHRFLNYDSDSEEIISDGNKETDELKNNDKKSDKGTVNLRMPIPDFLNPLIDKKSEQNKNSLINLECKKTATPKSLHKKVVTSKLLSAKSYSFLQSLDVSAPKTLCHPEALKYRDSYKINKEELTKILYKLYNENVFDNLLDLPVTWNKKLLNTAGRCFNIKKLGVRSCRIELSEKVLTSGDRLRCTLIHELCHAAAWIFDESNGHGDSWKKWVRKANDVFPELPKISTCHQYEIEYKYTYQCTLCKAKYQAHSKSKKVENIRCSYCHGKIEIFLNKKDKNGQIVHTPVRKASGFALFVQEKYKNYKKSDLKHADVMKLLGSEFSSLSVEEKNKY